VKWILTRSWFIHNCRRVEKKRRSKKKETDGELFLIEHIVKQFSKREKYTTKSFSKVFPNWRHDGRKKETPRKRKMFKNAKFYFSQRFWWRHICLESFTLSLAEWFPKIRRHYILLKFWNHPSKDTASQPWRPESSIIMKFI
jgi:hypothetical protein